MSMDRMIAGKTLEEWIRIHPLLRKICSYQPVTWLNSKTDFYVLDDAEKKVSMEDILDAEERWKRFSPYLSTVYPELRDSQGRMLSPLKKIEKFKRTNFHDCLEEKETLFLKCDHLLPIAGSIKARGGIYEVLKYAEKLALSHGMIKKEDDYAIFDSERFFSFFQNYSIGVGSTGNLALSIGIAGSKLGFNVHVYMSKDAREWKKEMLKAHGVTVHEFTGDFSEAIDAGRSEIQSEPDSYFIDDENSKDLFLGYSVAALELRQQLEMEDIEVSETSPLYVYLPCGVGGSPGGIAFGLKMVFGSKVHCFFAEPTHSPSVLIGLMTGLNSAVSVQDFGLDNKTEADGLAVGRPSAFASSISKKIVNGIYTEDDNTFRELGYALWKEEKEFIEPSAAAGLAGPKAVLQAGDGQDQTLKKRPGTHVAWSTGGSLVPETEREQLYKNGTSDSEDV